MIFISAQPDEQFFIWQLKLVISNLGFLGVKPPDIHILVAYNKERGLNTDFADFIKEYESNCEFYLYPDTRRPYKYAPTIRPHILSKHFRRFPILKEEILFYHDSDVLFSRIPNIPNLGNDDTCYVSDTRSYLDVQYIRQKGTEDLLEQMLDVVKLSKEKILLENENTGGAQYILKNVDSIFWDKVESDSERLFELMENYNELTLSNSEIGDHQTNQIQSWCADMWALLWNLWLSDRKVKIHPEMDFCWATSDISEWGKKSILHYSGNQETKLKTFKKSKYLYFPPWYDIDLKDISENLCGYIVVQQINRIRKEQLTKRTKFDHTIIVLVGEDPPNSHEHLLEKFNVNAEYILRYFDTEVLLLYKQQLFSNNNSSPVIYPLEIVKLKRIENVVFFPANWILEEKDLLDVLDKRDSYTCPKRLLYFDFILFSYFKDTLDINFLRSNIGKCAEHSNTNSEKAIYNISFQPEIHLDMLFEIAKKEIDNLSKSTFDHCFVNI